MFLTVIGNTMFEMLVGLEVSNNDVYDQYRTAMKPILQQFGGEFGYDFKIAEVLKNEADANINRVFTIRFPTAEHMDNFFSNQEYLAIKQEFFEASVAHTHIIASYEK